MLFFKKKIIEDGDILKKSALESCQRCKCLMMRSSAKVVIGLGSFGSTETYYCHRCKPAYDKVVYGHSYGNMKSTNVYYAMVEVNKDGNQVMAKK